MKKKSHIRIVMLTAMLTFGALAITKMTFYKDHYNHKINHCKSFQTDNYQLDETAN